MTIPKLTPYTGQVANPDGSQTQAEFTTNMFNQLSYEANLATELDATIDGMNKAVDEVNQNASIAENSANAAEAAASSAGYQGLWPDTGGSALKGETWQTQVGGTPTGEYYTALQNTSVDPVGDNVNWKANNDYKRNTKLSFDTLADAVANTSLKAGYAIEVKERIAGNGGGGTWDVVIATANGIDIVACTGVPALALALRHEGSVTVEQLGVVHTLSDSNTRTSNDNVIDSALDVASIKVLNFPFDFYYFHRGIHMAVDARAKALIGKKGKTPSYLLFDQVTARNGPAARRSTLAASADFMPINEPDRDNTAITYGTRAKQVGRVQFANIRPVNDSFPQQAIRDDKLKRNGTGFFINSGFCDYDRIVTEGWHVGSYEFSLVTERSMCEHVAFNIGFVFPGGTSSSLSGLFANGTNYDRDTGQFTVTYTAQELDEFQGFGYLFHNLFYSSFDALAADKIQKSYGIFGNANSYRASYEFIGCGSEFVEADFDIEAPNATVVIDGGQDWGIPQVVDANRVFVRNRRFPAKLDSDLSAGILVQDEQTFELQNPIELTDQPASVECPKGYNGLSYVRTKIDEFNKYWRIHGRLEVTEFQLRKNITVNGALTGKINFYYLYGNNAADFANSFGEVKVNTVRAQATSQQQSTIDAALNVTAAVNGNYYEITKPVTAGGGKFVVDIDLELKTGFSGDLAKTSTRPDDLTFKGIDY